LHIRRMLQNKFHLSTVQLCIYRSTRIWDRSVWH